jgi:hypothetical protein
MTQRGKVVEATRKIPRLITFVGGLSESPYIRSRLSEKFKDHFSKIFTPPKYVVVVVVLVGFIIINNIIIYFIIIFIFMIALIILPNQFFSPVWLEHLKVAPSIILIPAFHFIDKSNA